MHLGFVERFLSCRILENWNKSYHKTVMSRVVVVELVTLCSHGGKEVSKAFHYYYHLTIK